MKSVTCPPKLTVSEGDPVELLSAASPEELPTGASVLLEDEVVEGSAVASEVLLGSASVVVPPLLPPPAGFESSPQAGVKSPKRGRQVQIKRFGIVLNSVATRISGGRRGLPRRGRVR